MNISSALETYRYWRQQEEVRSEYGQAADKNSLRPDLEQAHPGINAIMQKLESEGVVAVNDYWATEKCTAGRAEIDRLIESYPAVVQKNSNAADNRMFGVEAVSPLLAEFHNDPFLKAVGEMLGGLQLYNFATLGARINATKENNGSGDGWHRDAHDFQFKAILYLSDVSDSNGPFEYLPGSHKRWRAALDAALGDLPVPPNTRYEPAVVDRMVSRFWLTRRQYPGKAGTLLLVNTSGIHRGRPLDTGSRYALTNYYYHPFQIDLRRVTTFPTLMPGASERIIQDLRLQ